MKRVLILSIYLIFIIPFYSTAQTESNYILIGWNDLGMHCANKDFSKIAILPPYNNIRAHLVLKGDSTKKPQIVTTGYKVTYSFPDNTYSVGKTNFWSFVQQLFGVLLNNDIGLKGAGLSGSMSISDNHFYVDGVPVTPYDDADLTKEQPFQLALLKAFDSNNNLLISTQPVVPVSNEISCVSTGCHTSENDILNKHADEEEGGFDKTKTPILCASCHSSNALGTKGKDGVPSLSLAIHDKHAEKTNDCYKCHPGQTTKCFRGVMFAKGLKCQTCHGDLNNVASTIENGRRPWLDEPRCGDSKCHGSNFSEESGKLFRESKGHSNFYCSACHGSPHAILPSTNDRDNIQNIAIQGYKGVLNKCVKCHVNEPTDRGPHGFLPQDIQSASDRNGDIPYVTELLQNYPNPFNNSTIIPFQICNPGKVRLDVIDSRGNINAILVNEYMTAGNYQIDLKSEPFITGNYIIRLTVGSVVLTKKMTIIR